MPLLHIEIRINLDKSEDVQLSDLVSNLKAYRQLSQVVRDGIRLIVDLQAGRLDVLHELFPFVSRSFVQDTVLDTVQDKPAGLKPLEGFSGIAMPEFEDEEDTIVIRKDVNAALNSSQSFIDSMTRIH
jgi:hypothetical protein